jgi:hypothetical protein
LKKTKIINLIWRIKIKYIKLWQKGKGKKKLKVEGLNQNTSYIQIRHQELNWKQIKLKQKGKWLKNSNQN